MRLPLSAFPDVQLTVHRLQQEALALLGPQHVGLYLTGSLALGDFDPARSDIDFVAVTSSWLDPAAIAALAAMHERLAAAPSKWGSELEGSYVPLQALRHHDPVKAIYPHIERGGALSVEQHHSDWLIQRHILRENGLTLCGPPPHTLVEPLSAQDLRQAVLDLLWWWELQLEETWRITQSGYQVYAILSMCRIRYTVAHGAIVSKPVAARWAQARLEARWGRLVGQALRWQPGEQLESLEETLSFIRYMLSAVR